MVEGCTAAVGAALSALSALSSGNEEEDNFTAVSALSKATWRGSTVSFKTFVPWRGKKRKKKKKDGGANKQMTVVSMLAKTKKVQHYRREKKEEKEEKKDSKTYTSCQSSYTSVCRCVEACSQQCCWS